MKSVVETLSDLIRIPSKSVLTNRPIIDYATHALHAAGWSALPLPYRDAAGVEKINLVAAPPGESPADPNADLVFMCHTDTVPWAADWTTALKPILRDGNLHGCGACDVKGFLACLLTAIAQADAAHLPPGLRLVLTADEEVGCVGAAHLVADAGLRPRRMIIGEPTSLHPARAGKGYCLAEITVHGKEAHSAHPQQGVSAIYHGARLIAAIEHLAGNLSEPMNSFFDPGFTTLNIGTIEGGTAKNIVPGLCRFQLEWRPIPGDAPDRILESVQQIIRRFMAHNPKCRVEIQRLRQQPGFETPAGSRLVRSVEALTGLSATSIPFGSEASLFAGIAEEIVVFGAGDMRTAHSSRECVPVGELEEAVACLAALLTAG